MSLARPVRELEPDACVRIGLEHNRTLRAVRLGAEASAARAEAVRAQRLPVLSAQGLYQRLSSNIPDFEVVFLEGIGTPSGGAFEVPALLNRYDLALRLEQPLFTGFRLHHAARSATLQAEAAGEEVAAAEVELAFQIREAYWALFRAVALRDAADAALTQLEAHLVDVRNLLAQGMALRSDLLAVQPASPKAVCSASTPSMPWTSRAWT